MSPNLRERLHGAGPALIATLVIVPRIEIVELVAAAGYDAVVLDQEHGPISIDALPALIAAARGAGLACIVRVPECRAKQIESVLDAGADGVLVPHVASAAAAAEIVGATRFAPEGRRGANPYVRAAGFLGDPAFYARSNERCACLAMVEGRAGVEAVDAILATPGLDGIFIGPVDLSGSLGYHGQPEHPAVVEAVRELIERGRERGVATAVFAPTPAAARRWLDLGVRLVGLSVDTAAILAGFRAQLDELRG